MVGNVSNWLQAWTNECSLAKRESRDPNPLFDKMSFQEYSTVEILSEEMDLINKRGE